MGRYEVNEGITIAGPIAEVFERLVDHEAMARWPGVQACTLIKDGSPTRNGLGAIRKVKAGGATLLEEIVQFEPPYRYDYSIIKGLPVDHRGTVTLTESGNRVRLSWRIQMSSRVPLLSALVGRLLKRGMPKALGYFKRETERALARPASPATART